MKAKNADKKILCQIIFYRQVGIIIIEILGATLEETCSIKREKLISADLHPILLSEERFCRHLNIVPLK
jgi:hypothetical protein